MKRILKFIIPALVLFSCTSKQTTSEGSLSLDSGEEDISSVIMESSNPEDFLGDKIEEFQRLADQCNYDFDPTTIRVEERKNIKRESLSASEINEITSKLIDHEEKRTNSKGDELHKIYSFYGTLRRNTSIGNYKKIDLELSLWEDGLVFGTKVIEDKEDVERFGGIWWNNGADLKIRCSISNKIVESELNELSTSDQFLLKFGIPYGPNLWLIGSYYYPDIGLFINSDIGHEVVANISLIGDVLTDCRTYRIDKKLNHHYIDSYSYLLEYVSVPNLKYPHHDGFEINYKGLVGTYDINVISAEGEYTIEATTLIGKSYSLFDRSFLSDIKLYKDGEDTGTTASNLYRTFNYETNDLTVFLLDGRQETIHINFNYEAENNIASGTFDKIDFEFVFKNLKQMEVKAAEKQETVNIEFYSLLYGLEERLSYISVVDKPEDDDSLINHLPKNMYFYIRASKGNTTYHLAEKYLENYSSKQF